MGNININSLRVDSGPDHTNHHHRKPSQTKQIINIHHPSSIIALPASSRHIVPNNINSMIHSWIIDVCWWLKGSATVSRVMFLFLVYNKHYTVYSKPRRIVVYIVLILIALLYTNIPYLYGLSWRAVLTFRFLAGVRVDPVHGIPASCGVEGLPEHASLYFSGEARF